MADRSQSFRRIAGITIAFAVVFVIVGLAFKLDIYSPIKNDGRFDDTTVWVARSTAATFCSSHFCW